MSGATLRLDSSELQGLAALLGFEERDSAAEAGERSLYRRGLVVSPEGVPGPSEDLRRALSPVFFADATVQLSGEGPDRTWFVQGRSAVALEEMGADVNLECVPVESLPALLAEAVGRTGVERRPTVSLTATTRAKASVASIRRSQRGFEWTSSIRSGTYAVVDSPEELLPMMSDFLTDALGRPVWL